ncbi:MAG: response regulator [Bacteroidales bacterium]
MERYGLEDNFLSWLDADKLEKVVSNLLSNALKFNGPGTRVGVLRCPLSREEAVRRFPLDGVRGDGAWVCISVADDGKGIPEDKIEKVFERYYQLENQTRETYNWGTGIGLYYARRLVELHHGFLRAFPRPQGGVEFAFVLPAEEDFYLPEERLQETDVPLRKEPALPADADARTGALSDAPDAKPMLLVIDDDAEVVHYLKTLLSSSFRVKWTYDADSALAGLKETGPDLILCDVVMPGTDGYAFSRKVKDSLSFSHIPVVLVTAKATVENQVEGLNCGADAYVTKPFDPSYLLAVIDSQLSNRKRIQRMLVGTTRSERIEEDALTPRDGRFMAEMYELMEKELSNPELNIGRMTEVLKISRTKFYYKVKGLTGENPGTLFKTYKLNRAAELILEGRMNISEIADVTGFSTPSHFSVSFKKHFGVSYEFPTADWFPLVSRISLC